MHAAKKRGQAPEVGLFPGLEGMVVTLGESSRTPRKARDTRAARRSGSGSSVSSLMVTETKFVAG